MFLITGFPRSGTGYASSVLRSAGIDAGHEVLGDDGVVSWPHFFGGGALSWMGEVESVAFDVILHQVRDPLKVIASAQTLKDESFEYMFDRLGYRPRGKSRLRWAMWAWLEINEAIEKVASFRYRVEDFSESWPEICRQIGVDQVPPFPKDVSKNTNARPHDDLTWEALRRCDRRLYRRIRAKADKYGYREESKTDRPLPSLSVVMMAKVPIAPEVCPDPTFEEGLFGNCLASVKPLADEIIIVDTGLNEKARETAEQAGAKIYPHNWEDNFSAGRNRSIGYASGDWLLFIDADEELLTDGRKKIGMVDALKFKAFLAAMPEEINAVSLLMRDVKPGEEIMQWNVQRCFRRGSIRYEGIVHNQPVWTGIQKSPLLSGFSLHHYGYGLDEKTMDYKRRRTVRLLEKRLSDDPTDIHVYFYLAQSHGMQGDKDKALECGKKYIEKIGEDKQPNGSIFYTVAQILIEREQYDEALRTIQQGTQRFPYLIDLYWATIVIGIRTGNYHSLLEGAELYCKAYDAMVRDPSLTSNMFVYSFNHHNFLTALYNMTAIQMNAARLNYDRFQRELDRADSEEADKWRQRIDGEFARFGVNLTEREN